jgi:hypothetical protein
MLNRTFALPVAGALVGGSALIAMPAASAHADGPEKDVHGSVAGARYEISIEKDRRFEIDAELEGVSAGSKWKMVVRHDGKRVATQRAHAVRDDGRHEVDFHDVHSGDTKGHDYFTVTLKRIDGQGKVTRTIRFAH